MSLEEHQKKWQNCQQCVLHQNRTQVVTFRGDNPCDVLLIGEAPGRSEDALGDPFCLHEDHRVLMADFSWKPLKDICKGDEILAPDETAPFTGEGASKHGQRKWRVAQVLGTRKATRECLQVETVHGKLIGTPDHRVAICRGRVKAHRWVEIQELLSSKRTRGSNLCFVLPVWEEGKEYVHGWLSGFFDGEGWVATKKNRSKLVCGYVQNAGPTSQKAQEMLTQAGFQFGGEGESRANGVVCERKRIKGGYLEVFRFLGTIRPQRLIPKAKGFIAARSPGFRGTSSKVRSVTEAGIQPVVDIQTTTGTFICEGFLVHNCGESGYCLNDLIQICFSQHCHLVDQYETEFDSHFNPYAPLSEMVDKVLRGQSNLAAKAVAEVHKKYPSLRVGLSNICCCLPLGDPEVEGGLPPIRPPERAEAEACRPRLLEIIKIVKPKAIVALGKVPAKFLPRLKDGLPPSVTHIEEVIHPSALIRLQKDDPIRYQEAYNRTVLILTRLKRRIWQLEE